MARMVRKGLTLTFDRTYEGLKRQGHNVPYRDGLAFDRTYEGLKPLADSARGAGLRPPFDRTYEGLKRVEQVRPGGEKGGPFDRTYEGLKPTSPRLS